MKRTLNLLTLLALPLCAQAEESNAIHYSLAAGSGPFGPAASLGVGTQTDVIELSAIDLGKVNGGTARFAGISLVQNATPKDGFNFLFRLGIGKETTTFPGNKTATRAWLKNGIFFGLGMQYQPTEYFALRAEANRIVYAASPDGIAGGIRYPATLSAMLLF